MARRDREVVLALGLAGAVGPADVGVDQGDEVRVVGVLVADGFIHATEAADAVGALATAGVLESALVEAAVAEAEDALGDEAS